MNPFDQFDEATTGNPFDQVDTPAPAAGIQAKDLAVSLKQGVQRLPSMLAGLADSPLAVAGLNRPMSRLADLAGEVTGFRLVEGQHVHHLLRGVGHFSDWVASTVAQD